MLVAGNSETTAVAFFHLIAPISGIITEEFHFVAVDGVLHVDKRTLQHEKVVDARHPTDAQRVDLINKLLLDGRGGMRQLVGGQLPTFQVGVILTKHAFVFLLAEVLTGVLVVIFHKLCAELHHLLHSEVAGERAVFVAIDAVLLVLAAVGVGAEDLIGERHSAALAKLLLFFHIDLWFVLGYPTLRCACMGLIALPSSCP